MKLSELLFVGIAGSVVALNRNTGEQVWATRLKGRDFVNVVLHEGNLLAMTYGEAFCRDAFEPKRDSHGGTTPPGRASGSRRRNDGRNCLILVIALPENGGPSPRDRSHAVAK